jgi:hypothetical protein
MGNRQGGPVVTPEAQLRESVNQIAINYILKAPFAELRALANYNTAQLNNYVFLTAELLNKTMSDREIEYIYNDIRGRPKIMSEPVIFFKADDVKSLDVPDIEKKRRLAVGIARFYVRILQVYAAIIDTLDPRYFSDLDAPREYKVERMAHDFRADDGSGFRTAYHFREVPTGAGTYKELPTPMSLCGRRLWALTGSTDETFDVKKNTDPITGDVRIKNHICDIHTNKSVRSEEVAGKEAPKIAIQGQMFGFAPQEKKRQSKLIRGPKAMKYEMGINSLEQLFLNSYNLMTGRFEFVGAPPTAGSPQRVDMAALAQYRSLIQKYTAIFGDPARPQAARVSEIVLSPIHAEAYCRGTSNPKNKDPDADALLNHSILVKATSPKFAAYMAAIKKMKDGMDVYRKRLIAIINSIFVKSSVEKAGGSIVTFSLNPRLTERSLEGLVEQVRTIIAEMYARCHLDFKEAVRIFVDIARDTSSGNAVVERSDADADVALPAAAAAAVAPAPAKLV